jgi:hypothetical protein
MARADGPNAFVPEQAAARWYVITFYFPTNGVSAKPLPPIGMAQDPVSPSIPKPIGATSPYGPSHVDPSPEPTRMPPIERLGGLLTASLLRSDNLVISQRPLAQGQDVVFESSSADSLLLAADLYRPADSSVDRVFDDWRTVSDGDESGFFGLDQLSLDEKVNSLDAVWREREAVDTVFGNLRELHDRHSERKYNTPEEQITAHETRHHERDIQPPPAEAAEATDARHNVANGGMVLLVPTGDPNLGVGNPLEDLFQIVESENRLPVGIEASIGAYQAMEVGSVESPNVNAAKASAPRPADGRPNLTSENTAEKRSEQPS